ncbi:MAG: hypothetical protein NTZ09_03150, partial [Candidatus Hydrogenedentes bacterium]|nr:hypothetical protein [Candidatus Hydrogenedentota bacterium]
PAGALAGLLGDTIRCSVCGAPEGDLYEIGDDDEGRVVLHHSYTDLQTPEVREPAPEDEVGEKHGETFAVVPQNFFNESLAPNMPGLSWSWGQGFGLEDGVGGQGASPSGMGQNLGFGNTGGGVSAEGTSGGDAGASGGGE